jgi:hypothetical protein
LSSGDVCFEEERAALVPSMFTRLIGKFCLVGSSWSEEWAGIWQNN